MTFGKIIQEARKNKMLTISKVASECGVSASYISDLEKGKTEAYSEGITYKIAEVLDLDGDELILAKGNCPRWVQEWVVKNWDATKAFIESQPKKKKAKAS